MTFADVALRLNVRTCFGACGLSNVAHDRGRVFLGVVHWTPRRMTRRALRNYLQLVARQRRESDPGYLNDELYDWLYLALDSMEASRMARSMGVVLPARLFDQRREQCRALAARRGVNLRKYRSTYEWLRRKAR